MTGEGDWTPASDQAWDNLFASTEADLQAYFGYLAVAMVSDFIFVCRHFPDQVKTWLDEVKSVKEQIKRGEGPNLVGDQITGCSFPANFWMILGQLYDHPELDPTDIPSVHRILKPGAFTQAKNALDDFITLYRKELGDHEADNNMAFLGPYPGTREQWQRIAAIKMAELAVRQRQCKLARNPRRDALQNVIMAIAKEDPAITAPKLWARLRRKAGPGSVVEGVHDGIIEWIDGKGKVQDTSAHAVKDRLSRAKKALGLSRRKSR